MVRIFQVDAFTDRPFAGNPAAVVLLDEAADEAWMQAVAAEMNLSETAFLHPTGDAWSLRWFTPAAEVDLCGHATLASAHVLWTEGYLDVAEPARFDTRSGRLTCTRVDDGWIAMDLPVLPCRPDTAPGISDVLGAEPTAVFTNDMDKMVAVTDEATLRGLSPDFRAWKALGHRGVIVTAQAEDPDADYVCRYFAPGVGIDEDPVTGSIQCALGPYWQERLGKDDLVARQLSERGGTLRVSPRGGRVAVAGQAVTTLRGDLVDA